MDTLKGRLFQKLEIGLASPKQIRQWAERYLPNGETVGEVTSWETVNYKTLKPEPNGLFCQKIFGPVIDFTCACGKKSNKVQIGFCSKCGVERTHSRVRRYRLGYIKLKQPIVHPLYASHKPSPLSLCLDWSNKRIQALMYGTEFCHLSSQFRIFCSNLEFIPFSRRTTSVKFENGDKTEVSPKFRNLGQATRNVKITNSLLKNISFEKQNLKTDRCQIPEFDTSSNNKTKVVFSPRLFEAKKQLNHKLLKHIYPSNQLDLGLHLYGVAYDTTWRQVEDLQEFLFFQWEHSFQYEYSIPYYSLTKSIEKNTKDIPIHDQYYPIQTGGFVFQHILAHFDLIRFQRQLKLQYHELKNVILYIQEKIEVLENWDKEKLSLLKKLNRLKQLEKKCLRRLQYFRDFYKTTMQPAWMILSYLPVLPPGLRPITSIRGELIVSDINSLYRKVLIRNKRITSGTAFGIFDTALSGSWASWCYNLRQVQEAIDGLLKTGSIESGKTTKSLLDALKGKKGRFRQHLLGKRVDYSGRSVIVVGPQLKIHECGLPKQMAIELFQPFIIQKLRKKGIVFTTTAAKALIAERKPIVWSILGEILKTHPVLLNRAPTLHRLGIQAFLPKLVEGKAILLHPLVCPAFNADFDGDQMAVHIPLSVTARAEALNLLWSRNHLLAPSSGQPLLLPTQDMVLGFYYLTCSKEINLKGLDIIIPSQKALVKNQALSDVNKNIYFSDFSQVKNAFDRGFLKLHSPIWVKWSGFVQNFFTEAHAKNKENLIETRLDIYGHVETVFIDTCKITQSTLFSKSNYIRTTPGRIFMHYCIYQ